MVQNNSAIYEILPKCKGAGYFSKELISKMIVGFKRRGLTLTDLFISQKDMNDVNNWTKSDIDPATHEEIFSDTKNWMLFFHILHGLNKPISGKTQIFGMDFNNSVKSNNQKLSIIKKCFKCIAANQFNINLEKIGIGFIRRK